ncbi:carbohydrate ABC transporter permease [Microlunatus sp. Y2014]|uniref:carbohydrate ABC transporter permease n=1 Tax=Microlunatus sp. Y2014 TaxID=3418488 RepID=UPI003DA74E39
MTVAHTPVGGPEVATPRHSRGSLGKRLRQHRWHLAFVTPMVVLYLLFTAWPMIASWWYAVYDWTGYGPLEDFVGLGNFAEAFGDPQFWNAARNTAIFALFAIFVQLPLALVIAMVLNDKFLRGRNVYRAMFFLPVVTTTAVVGVVFAVLLDPSGGPVNEVVLNLGGTPINFLGSDRLALPTVLVVDMWKGIGVTIIYWLAALQTVPEELIEAARIDGANRFQILTRVIVPLLLPLAAVILLLTFVTSMNAFDLIQVMTEGGPSGATDIVQTYIYRYAFNPDGLPRFGYASAVGIVFGVAVMLVTVLPPLLRWLSRLRRRPSHQGASR